MVFLDYLKNSCRGFFFNYDSLDYVDENITHKSALFSSWAIFVILLGLGILSHTFTEDVTVEGTFNLYYVLAAMITYPLWMLLISGSIHLLLKIVNGKGSFNYSFKYFLSIMQLPIIINLTLFIFQPVVGAGVIIARGVATFVMFFWIITLAINIYSVIHNITMWRVFNAIVMIPFVLFISISMMLSIVLVPMFVDEPEEPERDLSGINESATKVIIENLNSNGLQVENEENSEIVIDTLLITGGSCSEMNNYTLLPGENIIALNCSNLQTGEEYKALIEIGNKTYSSDEIMS